MLGMAEQDRRKLPSTGTGTGSQPATSPDGRLQPVTLWTVLNYFQHPACDLRGIGILGFHRHSSRLEWTRAYSCRHVYSAVLLKLDELGGIQYDPNIYCWEDIDFNRRCSAPPLHPPPPPSLHNATIRLDRALHLNVFMHASVALLQSFRAADLWQGWERCSFSWGSCGEMLPLHHGQEKHPPRGLP